MVGRWEFLFRWPIFMGYVTCFVSRCLFWVSREVLIVQIIFAILVVFNRSPPRLNIRNCKNDELQPFPDHHLDYPCWCGLPTLWILSIGTQFFGLEKKDGWPWVMSQGWIMLWALLVVAAVYVLCLLKDWADKRSTAQKFICSFSRCY